MAWFEMHERNSPQLFWLNGIAGIGKSTVASTISSIVDKRGELGASHFFSRINGRINHATVFTSFAYQLSKYDRRMKKEIAQALDEDSEVGFQAIKDQFRLLIVEPLSRLPFPPNRLLFVIDALDECQEAGAEELLTQLLAQVSHIPFLKVLITGRPEHHITSTLHLRKGHETIVMHDIEQHVVEGDMDVFFRGQFRKIQEQFRRMGVIWEWTEEQLRELVRRAGKLFIYAVTVCKYIGDRGIAEPAEQLRIVLGAGSVLCSSSPYADLDALYTQLLSVAIPPKRDDRLVERFHIAVGAIITLVEPLPIDALVRLTNLPIAPLGALLVKLSSVLSIPDSCSDTLEIYHPSFPDFLKDPRRCEEERYLIVPAHAHARLAANCLDLMILHLKRDMCGIKDHSKMNKDVEGLEDRVRKVIPPWLRYACLHWGQHVINAPAEDVKVVESLERFCQVGLVYWIEALSVLGCLESATQPLIRIQNWAVRLFSLLEG